MSFTSKVSNILKQQVGNMVGSSISSFANNLMANGGQKKKLAAKLLNKSPLEIGNIDPTAHMKENPYQYGTVYYPQETSNLGEGHYIIFDVVMHKSSKFKTDKQANVRVIPQADYGGTFAGGNSYQQSVQKIKNKNGFAGNTRLQGVKSGLNQKTPTHTFLSDSIILYTPGAALKFGYGANYEGIDTGVAGLLGDTLSGIKDFDSAMAAIKGGGADAVKMLARSGIFGAASLIPGFENAEAAYDKAKGQAVNPQQEMVFSKVNFREFEFPFEFAPKNAKEKDQMHKIINLFKFHMHPEYQGSTKGFFNVPSEFQITYMYRENINTYIPRISRCVLANMNIDFAPEGVFSAFKADQGGAAPVMATMNLTFKETEIMTKERIAEGF